MFWYSLFDRRTQLKLTESVENALRETWKALEEVDCRHFWGFNSRFHTFKFHLSPQEISPELRPLLDAYFEAIKEDAESYFELEEDLLVAGINGLFQRMRVVPPPSSSSSSALPDAIAVVAATPLPAAAAAEDDEKVIEALKQFLKLYDVILEGLPDVTLEDYVQRDRIRDLFTWCVCGNNRFAIHYSSV